MMLNEIVARKKEQLLEEEMALPLAALEKRAADAPQARDFFAALAAEGLSVIAEVKRASPSKGLIAPDFRPVDVAREYEAGGAAAVSVLTEKHFFRGDDSYLTAIRQAVALPVLRKDFIIAERQVVEARAIGADAMLLIAAILCDERLKRLRALADGLGMACLVEAHDEREVKRAADCGARIIGVNNRDLKTFAVSLDTFARLRPFIPAGTLAVAESGIQTPEDALKMRNAGADAILVGESLMRSRDSAAAIRAFRGKAG
jgi:indole-3-glycerol phosphate synthase